MDIIKLESANALLENIKHTEDAIEALRSWREKSNKLSVGANWKSDYNYNLCICEHRDGSGKKLDLARYFGNTKLLQVIEEELNKQLAEFKEEFARM